MRVAFAHYSSSDDISGVTSWLVRLAKRLDADGAQVAIHLQHLGDDDPEGASIRKQLAGSGIFISAVACHQNLSRDVGETLSFINRWQPTVFLPQCKNHHYVAAAIAGEAGLPWVLTLHSDDPDYWNVLKALPPSNYGGKTVCVSRHIEEIVKREHGDPSPYLIPYGVIVPEAAAAFSSNPFKVAYSGRIWEYQKRASLVVQSLIQACRQDGSLEAVMIGDGYLREACQQQVREAGLEKIITFAGQLAPRGVQQVLNDCQAILLMSDFEGLPVALLEAMAMGVVPVVRAIRSGIPELVEHEVTGLLVNEDPEVAAAAVVRLAHDQSLWQGCSRGARELVESRYRFEATYGQWQKLLAELNQSCSFSNPVNIWPGSKIVVLERIFQSSQPRKSKFLLSTSHRFRTGLATIKHCAKRFLARLRSKMSSGTR